MSTEPEIDVVVRCRNEMPYTKRALEALLAQKSPRARVLVIDCQSTDGSRQVAEQLGLEVLDWDPKAYVPGRVLNEGMKRTRSEVVAFVNADAIAQSDDALARLVSPLYASASVVATYGRQLARTEADRLTKVDYARAFPEREPVAVRLGAFFSMAGSAISRRIWSTLPFDEALRYSEDVDFTRRARALGYEIVYVPDAAFEHSHDYDVKASFKRRRGEGAADTAIYRMGGASIVRDFARPLVGALLRDARARVLAPRELAIRVAQASGYFVGRRESSQIRR